MLAIVDRLAASLSKVPPLPCSSSSRANPHLFQVNGSTLVEARKKVYQDSGKEVLNLIRLEETAAAKVGYVSNGSPSAEAQGKYGYESLRSGYYSEVKSSEIASSAPIAVSYATVTAEVAPAPYAKSFLLSSYLSVFRLFPMSSWFLFSVLLLKCRLLYISSYRITVHHIASLFTISHMYI